MLLFLTQLATWNFLTRKQIIIGKTWLLLSFLRMAAQATICRKDLCFRFEFLKKVADDTHHDEL